MSEEVEDAAITVPRSMVATVLLNGGLGFGMLIAILFSIGSKDEALSTKTGYPVIEIVFNAVEDKLATSAIIGILIAMFVFATVGIMASSSRLTWAFARDKGLPFSQHLARIHPRFKLPLNAIILTAIINLLLSLINIASVTAFNAMLSLAIISLYLTYVAPIILILYLRVRYPTSIEWGPFRMGRVGPAVNLISVIYTAYAWVPRQHRCRNQLHTDLILRCIFLLFPPYAATNSENMNWTVLVCGATVLGAACTWFFGAKHRYKGPLKEL
jgi:amino acid transporter